jgi:RNA polymerase sigma-70 factor (ECF subfamily)
MDDRAILDDLRAGSEAAFDAIFRAYYAQLVVVAQSLLGVRAAAEDAAQDVMLELWRRRENIVLETSLRAYLIRSVRNRALNQIRHDRVVHRAGPHYEGPAPAPLADRAQAETELDQAVQQAVRELPERCREAFELSRGQGLSYAEIAQVLGVSVKTVEAHMGKALRLLRERLAGWLTSGTGDRAKGEG